MADIPNMLKQGEPARLIPIVASSSREQRITSVLLSVISSVDEYGRHLLHMIGAPVRKTSKIYCYTEIVFSQDNAKSAVRPDGLIMIRTGKNEWKAIIESKIGTAELDANQIECYLDLARKVGADAVITISNQYATRITHHPVDIPKNKLRSIRLNHWSWGFVLTQAHIYAEYKGIEDPDQAFILKELIRFLDHPSTGILDFSRMPKGWKDVCTVVQQGGRLAKGDLNVGDCISSWHELTRFIGLKMSSAIGENIAVYLARKHEQDAVKLIKDDTANLCENSLLHTRFTVPNAANYVDFIADITRRTITVSMRIQPPKDRSLAKAIFTWVINQLSNCPDEDLVIVAKWPGKTPDTLARLKHVREDRMILLSDKKGQMPASIELRQVSVLGARFKGTKTFVEDAVEAFPPFYQNVVQEVRNWTPKPPKIRPDEVPDDPDESA